MSNMKMDIDTFGEVIDKFLKDNNVQMVITLPKGTMEPIILDNTSLGSTIQFYILLHTLEKVLSDVCKDLKISEKEKILKGLLELIYKDCLEVKDE